MLEQEWLRLALGWCWIRGENYVASMSVGLEGIATYQHAMGPLQTLRFAVRVFRWKTRLDLVLS